jgi:uncharacterized protein YciI
MKFALALFLAAAAFAQEPKYEMDNYVVGILVKGPKWTPDVTPELEKIQEGHMANIRRMAATGKLIVAGPFSANNDRARGMFIFKTTLEDAQQMVAEDPAVKAGRLVLELYPWFAAKGLTVAPPVR